MLPAAGFHHSIQDAWNCKSNACTFELNFPEAPNRKALDDKDPCAKAIMGDHPLEQVPGGIGNEETLKCR